MADSTTKRPRVLDSVTKDDAEKIAMRYLRGESIKKLSTSTGLGYTLVRDLLLSRKVELRPPSGGYRARWNTRPQPDFSPVDEQRATACFRLDPSCVMKATVDPSQDTHARIEIIDPHGDVLLLVMNEVTMSLLVEQCATAKEELIHTWRRNWSPADVLPDELWTFVEPFIPLGSRGPLRKCRATFAAITYVLLNKCSWNDIPDRFPVSRSTVTKRFHEWRDLNLWENIYTATYLDIKTLTPLETGLSQWSVELCQMTHWAAVFRVLVDDRLARQGPRHLLHAEGSHEVS